MEPVVPPLAAVRGAADRGAAAALQPDQLALQVQPAVHVQVRRLRRVVTARRRRRPGSQWRDLRRGGDHHAGGDLLGTVWDIHHEVRIRTKTDKTTYLPDIKLNILSVDITCPECWYFATRLYSLIRRLK